MRKITLLLSALLLSAGQSLAAPVEPNAPPKAEERICVPPGLPPFSTWRGGGAEMFIAQDELGRPVMGIQRDYEARGQKISTFWVGGLLVTVDPAPEDKGQPGWHDRGALQPDTRLRVEPRQACEWFRPPPRGRDQT